MKEKLIIKNFGPIKNVELELGRFNVLIGEQATGKSTVAKVLAVCRYFSYILAIQPFDNELFKSGLREWGLIDFLNETKTYISYSCEHYFFEVRDLTVEKIFPVENRPNEIHKLTPPDIEVSLKPLSAAFKSLLKAVPNVKPKDGFDYSLTSSEWGIPTAFYKNEVASILDNPFYFPVERSLQSLFSLGKYSTSNFYDKLYEYFARVDKISQEFKSDVNIEPLGISYKNENERGVIKSDRHDFVKLINAASGYQSTIPVVLTIKYYNKTKKKGKTFIIEEPELNLFPNAQQKLMEFLVEQVTNHTNSFLLTTHSPYVLTSINNMMYAHQVGQNGEHETEKVIEKQYWLNPDAVSAYMLLPDGTCESIMDKEEKLIKADRIDAVSGLLNEQFEQLLNIQLVDS